MASTSSTKLSPSTSTHPHQFQMRTPTSKRRRSRTVSDLDDWTREFETRTVGVTEDWVEAQVAAQTVPSSSRCSSVSGSDSAYGTLEEDTDGSVSRKVVVGLKKRTSLRRLTRRRNTRSRSVGDDGWTATTTTAADTSLDQLPRPPMFDFAVNDSFDDLLSSSTAPSTPSDQSSRRSSPEPSECDFDFRLASSSKLLASPSRRNSRKASDSSLRSSPVFLTRRHTVPRRKRPRGPSVSVSLVSSPTQTAQPVEEASSTLWEQYLAATPLSASLATLSAASSTSADLLPFATLLHASPTHLLRSSSLHWLNAFLSPLLVTPSASSIALAAANFASLRSLEEEVGSSPSLAVKATLVSSIWLAIVGLRVSFAYIFGRLLGWAHPHLFSTSAIHEVGAGLAPLLLALHIVAAYRRSTSSSTPISFQIALLAANLSTPIEQGGTGFWWSISGVIVGFVICAVLALVDLTSSKSASQKRTTTSYSRFAPLLTLLLLPVLASYSAPPVSQTSINASFASLHPQSDNLVTVLLMTAPRPGNPDFLHRTVESWLQALPSPTSLGADRVRMVVYTHFASHDVFDSARKYFSTSPEYAKKANHYLEWHRDPRATVNRLDQRLHVARGLDYAAHHRGEPSYVLLTEDDFPLCPRESSFEAAWDEFKRVMVATNEAMPDLEEAQVDEEESAGHCGVFLSTGGSGLAIRGFIARKLPSLLLGADDPHGNDRDARAARGEIVIKREGEGADTPDLVIQDCLRGRLEECRVCAAGLDKTWPQGSARAPGGVMGERTGKSGLSGTRTLMQRHLGYNASTLPGRSYGKEEWACGWRQPFNGEPDVLTV